MVKGGKLFKELLGTNIKKVDSVNDWKEAIKISCIPLINEGCIKEGYIDDIINNVEKNGPYIILDEGFALPHAERGENVLNTGLSYLYVKNGIDLMGNTVYAFLTLSAKDDTEHIKALQELSIAFDNEKNMERILNGDIESIID